MLRDGILLIDKPSQISSAAAIKKVQKKFNISKIGHAGTLDPFATGLLVVLLGEATKISRFLLHGKKSYEALARIGFSTDTGDLTGVRNSTEVFRIPDRQSWEDCRLQFLGEIWQVPPQFSAIKVRGKPLYAYARAQEKVEVEPRRITIEDLELLEVQADTLCFRVSCSGGTYIRVLAEDWAKACGTRAHLQELRRTKVGPFLLERAMSLAAILAEERFPENSLVSIPEALRDFPQIPCTHVIADKIIAGRQEILHDLVSGMLNSPPFQSTTHALLVRQHAGESAPDRALALVARCPDYPEKFQLERVFH